MVGIFDSGVGGLTVVKEIKKLLPDVSLIYFGDTARLPYGNKSPQTIKRFSQEIVEFLRGQGCEIIVVACNTASALAADWLRKRYGDLTIYDVVSSGAQAVVKRTKTKRVGVIGTSATISSGAYEKKIAELDPQIKVFSRACPLFVPLVEENWVKRPETKKIARVYLRNLKLNKIDTLLLGCTHYPLLEKVISGVIGPKVKITSSGEKLAEDLKACYNKNKDGRYEKTEKYFVSDTSVHFSQLAQKILGKKIAVKKKVL